MARKFFSWLNNYSALEIAIVIAISIGICIAAVLIVEIKNEHYSTVYIYPESYQNYPESPSISFVYGIQSYETERTSYDVNFFVNSLRIDTKKIDLNPGEKYEEKKNVELPSDLEYPVKIKITGTTPYGTNEVHYWLRTKPSSTG